MSSEQEQSQPEIVQNDQGNVSPWFNDARFNFVTSRHQLQQNITQLISEINGALVESPAVLAQLRQRLETVSDLIRQGQGVVGDPVATEIPNAANSVVLNMNGETDEDADTEANQEEEENTNGGNNLNAELRRIRELVGSPEIQTAISMSLHILPFMMIIMLKLFFDHFDSIAALGLSILCFLLADSAIMKAVSTRGSGQCCLLKAIISISVWTGAMFFYFDAVEAILKTLSFQLSTDLSDGAFLGTVYVVLVTDFALKFIGMTLKVVIVMLPQCCMVQKRRRRFYQWIEYSIQQYRYVSHIIPWFNYIKTTHSTRHISVVQILCIILSVAYCFVQFSRFRQIFIPWCRCSRYLFRLSAVGRRMSISELNKQNTSCPICYLDYIHPTKLSCGHIFCEDCITTWLDKERTCPICRRECAQEDNEWKSGATSWFPAIF